MSKPVFESLSRRERQVMDILYRLNHATAAQVQSTLDDAPSYSGVRQILAALERKGHVRIQRDGIRYVYRPTVNRENARLTALDNVIETFFGGSLSLAVSTMLEDRKVRLSRKERDQLEEILGEAEKEGR